MNVSAFDVPPPGAGFAAWMTTVPVVPVFTVICTSSEVADRLGISGPAVNRLEHAEVQGGITIAKLDQVARALDCTLVYGLVPNSTLEETVLAQATSEATALLGYAARTMALEDQGIDDDHQGEAVDRYARELVAKGNVWRTTGARPGR